MTRTRSRRSVLAGTGLAVASAGCVGRARNIVSRDPSDQLTLEVLTTPADGDPNAIRIAQHLREHMSEAGINARINTVDQAELLRRSLINHDYDIYVGQFPEAMPFEADALYSFVHSRFAAESGWQNPFGFTELAVDDLLAEQRSADTESRMGHLAELQDALCELQPLSVVAFPDAVTAYRDERFEGWGSGHPTSAQGLLRLSYVPPDERDEDDDADDDEPITLRLTTTDDRITENWNPIAVEYRRHGTFTSLLYDPLVRRHEDGPLPWLAEGWEWADAETIRVTLRDANWHDGEPLTSDDVAFTYEFLRDTSLGEAETPIPTPIFRGRTTIPDAVTAVDPSTVEFDMGSVNSIVAARALEVPILPEHIWRDRTELVTIAGIAVDEETTEALVSPNDEPVGSGPITVVDATAETEVVFERNPDHFLLDLEPFDPATEGGSGDDDGPGEETGTDGTGIERDDSGDTRPIPNAFRGKPSFERLVIEVVPSDIAAVQQVGDGLADGTLSNIGPEAVPRIGREADARLVNVRSAAFYHVGYNVRRAPLSNPRFRAILASLIDKAAIVDDAFQGYAAPATSVLAASPGLVPDDLRWDDDRGTDAVHPFRGEDGELDTEAVREAFREAGYRYNAEGELLSRDQ